MVIDNLVEEWRSAGIQEGDLLLIHSNIKGTLRRFLKQGIRVSPKDILDSFIMAVGSKGTLLFPLFNFDFTKGIYFDISTTPSQMGALSEVARLYPDSVRTGHPIYSFAAIGFNAKQFLSVDNFSGYGGDSPFGLLREFGGKIAVLDLPDQNSMTYYHHIEEMNKVDYRYHKVFSGKYTDILNHTSLKQYGLFVRNIEKNVLTHVNPAGELMWKEGLYSGFKPKEGCGLRCVRAQEMFEFITQIILSGKAENTLYRIGDN